MNSLPWIGKISGCLGSEVSIEKTGFKKTMYAVGIIQVIGVVSEVPAATITALFKADLLLSRDDKPFLGPIHGRSNHFLLCGWPGRERSACI